MSLLSRCAGLFGASWIMRSRLKAPLYVSPCICNRVSRKKLHLSNMHTHVPLQQPTCGPTQGGWAVEACRLSPRTFAKELERNEAWQGTHECVQDELSIAGVMGQSCF